MSRFLPLIAVWAACEVGATDAAAVAYHDAIKPVFEQNRSLSGQLLTVALAMGEDPGAAEAARGRLRSGYLVAARDVASSASVLTVPDSWRGPHEALVGAWQARASGYDSLTAAADAGDAAAWAAALASLERAREAEAAAVVVIETRLAADGLVLNPWGAAGP